MMKPYRIFNQKGFTLVELMVSLIIMAFVTFASFQMISSMQKNYAQTQAYIQVSTKASIATNRLASDIRSAARPNENTYAINVINNPPRTGDTLDVYTSVNTGPSTIYKQIRYQLSVEPGKTYGTLRRTIWETTTPHTGVNPQYALDDPTPVTVTLLKGVKDSAIFTDITAGTDERREIRINLILQEQVNKYPVVDDLDITQVYVSRTQQ